MKEKSSDWLGYVLLGVLFLCVLLFAVSIIRVVPLETSKRDVVVARFHRKESVFRNAAETGNWSRVERLGFVKYVEESETKDWVYIMIYSEGMAVHSRYYGLCWVKDGLRTEGDSGWTYNGTAYERTDNEGNLFIMESLGDWFYYCETHF